MKFTTKTNPENKSKEYHLIIEMEDMVKSKSLDEYDKQLIKKSEASEKISDKLLGLRIIALRIEESHN